MSLYLLWADIYVTVSLVVKMVGAQSDGKVSEDIMDDMKKDSGDIYTLCIQLGTLSRDLTELEFQSETDFTA